MTASAPRRGFLRNTLIGWRTRLQAAHPTTVLRWLRAGVVAMVAATALLYLVVSTEAEQQLAAARRTDAAIKDIKTAQDAAGKAGSALKSAFVSEQVSLIGTGTDFANHTASVSTHVTSAAEGNAAGERGRTQIQFVQGQLTTCLQLADTAVRDYARTGVQGMNAAHEALTDPRELNPDTGLPIAGTGGLVASLNDLRTTEEEAQAQQRKSLWLDPAYVYPLLVGPAAVMMLLVLATGHVVARHFRRYVSPLLLVALLATASAGVATAVRSTLDARDLAEHPLARHPLTLTLALASLATAAVLAHLAYSPRLAEYRFPRSGRS
ncbi:hypothetical protein [Streptomyces sp. NPDC050428]|uniref:hypothetical protein n=1 Tax=Streptomyces sp. NPDC050428 TaxID=3155757 RepID=UPI00341A3259